MSGDLGDGVDGMSYDINYRVRSSNLRFSTT